jgi:transcriptional regulator with XRE-family HTH domain
MEQLSESAALAKAQVLGEMIRAWREDETLHGKRLSHAEAAKRLGREYCSPAHVCHLEQAERAPGLHLAIRLEEVVGINHRAWPFSPRKRAASRPLGRKRG